MKLSTGKIDLKSGSIGVENLRLIIKALHQIAQVIKAMREQPKPTTFWGKVGQWFRGIFVSGAAIEQALRDIAEIAQNAQRIKEELLDLNGEELADLIAYCHTLGYIRDRREWLTVGVPKLLDAIQIFARELL